MKKNASKTLTKTLTKPDLAAYVVYLLGGDKNSIDTEDIAVKVNELVPGVFAWKKYPNQINLKLIESFLYDAKKPRCGELLLGTSRQGWRLSSKGIDWIANYSGEFIKGGQIDEIQQSGSAGTDPKRKEREKNRLLLSKAWAVWNDAKKLSVNNAQELFRVNDYTTDDMIENKVVRMRSLFMDDKDIQEFISGAAELLLIKGEQK